MNKNDINNLVTNFVKKLDLRKGREKILESWNEYLEENFKPEKKKTSTKTKNSYMFYAEHNREKMKEQFPGLSSSEITTKLSEGWAALKKSNNDEYKKYCDMANAPVVEYEVSKPFHKFSLQFRKKVEDEFPDRNAKEITEVLVERWKKLSRDEKQEWNL